MMQCGKFSALWKYCSRTQVYKVMNLGVGMVRGATQMPKVCV